MLNWPPNIEFLIIEDGVYQKNLFEHLKQKIKCKEYEKIETAGIFTCGFLYDP